MLSEAKALFSAKCFLMHPTEYRILNLQKRSFLTIKHLPPLPSTPHCELVTLQDED